MAQTYLLAKATAANCTPRDKISMDSRQIILWGNFKDHIFFPFDV